MFDRRLAAGLLLLLVPAISDAQRRVRGEPDANWDRITARDAEPTVLTRKEVEAMDPVRELIAKRKDVKLTEAQLAQLKAMEDSGKVRDAAIFATMDSLRKEMRPVGQMDDIQRMRIQLVRREFAATVVRIRAHYDAAGAAALQALDEAQRAKASGLLAKQKEESDEVVREKLGGGGGRGPGGPPGGPAGGAGGTRRPPAA